MIYLEQGMTLPVVTTAQLLLRQSKPYASVNCTGNFDPFTRVAVVNFQKFHKVVTDGAIGKDNWDRLTSPKKLRTIDVVDGTDQSLVDLEVKDIRKQGGNPIILYAASNGVQELVEAVKRRATGEGSVALLRIHGHGGPGMQGVSTGQNNGQRHLAGISDENFGVTGAQLAQLKSLMCPYGSVQLLGCNVGEGSKGKSLVNKLTESFGVPVTAAVLEQLGGGRNTFTFEGPTVTGIPGGGTIKSWSQMVQSRHDNFAMAV
jgi:peptidoglycan hydrolase-like protein with peptidoglycan-binding domain